MAKPPEDYNRLQGVAQGAFSPAAKGEERPAPMEAKPSDMVTRKAPTPVLAPSGPLRNSVDGQVHQANLARERGNEAARQEQAQKALADLKARNKGADLVKSKGKDDPEK